MSTAVGTSCRTTRLHIAAGVSRHVVPRARYVPWPVFEFRADVGRRTARFVTSVPDPDEAEARARRHFAGLRARPDN